MVLKNLIQKKFIHLSVNENSKVKTLIKLTESTILAHLNDDFQTTLVVGPAGPAASFNRYRLIFCLILIAV